MVVYVQILDQVNRERKYSMTGQLSLFDIVSDDQKSEFDIPLPDVGEYEKETKLAFEKEVLGVYLSGHPLEDYEEKWRKIYPGRRWISSWMMKPEERRCMTAQKRLSEV